MLISLHKQATTTPKIRAAIQASDEPAWLVAERYGISEQTVWKWRSRDDVHDRSHTPHRLQTTLTPPQEAVAVALRKALLLPLDDLLAVVREFLNPHVSRSGLDRCLRRHGVGNLQALKPKEPKPAHGSFKAYEPGYLHIDIKYLPQMTDESARRYLFVAIDRATRWVFVRIYPAQTAANARRFLRDLQRAAPMKITRVLTDNGKAFTDRLFGLRRRAATGQHEFDLLCADLGIEHRLAPPMRPQTNGMVERFNGRIEDVLQSHRFQSGEDLELTLLRYVHLYNSQLPQSVLKGRTPIDALKDWQRQRPELFRKRVYNHAGCDSYGLTTAIQIRRQVTVNIVNLLRLMIWRPMILAAAMVLPLGATAAEVEISSDPDCRIEINGVINRGAFQRLVGVLDHLLVFDGESTSGSAACLNSPGGNLIEALMIARLFLEEGVQTTIREGAECMSACAIVFMMGNVNGPEVSFLSRTMHHSSLLGFHRPKLSIQEARSFTSGEIEDAFDFGVDAIYEIMSLATSNTPWHHSQMMEPDLIQKMIGTPADSMYLISTIEQALRWQISLEGLPDFGQPSPMNLISACENALSLDVALTSSRNAGGLLSESIFYFDAIWGNEFISLLRNMSLVEGTGRIRVESPRSGYSRVHCEVEFLSNHVNICGIDESTSLRVGNCEAGDVEYFGRLVSLHPSTDFRALPFSPGGDAISAAFRLCNVFSDGVLTKGEQCLHEVSISSEGHALSVWHTLSFSDGTIEVIEVVLGESDGTNGFFLNGIGGALLPSGNCVGEASGRRFLCSEAR